MPRGMRCDNCDIYSVQMIRFERNIETDCTCALSTFFSSLSLSSLTCKTAFLSFSSSARCALFCATVPFAQSHRLRQTITAPSTATSPRGMRSISSGGGAIDRARSGAGLSRFMPPSARPRATAAGVAPSPSRALNRSPRSGASLAAISLMFAPSSTIEFRLVTPRCCVAYVSNDRTSETISSAESASFSSSGRQSSGVWPTTSAASMWLPSTSSRSAILPCGLGALERSSAHGAGSTRTYRKPSFRTASVRICRSFRREAPMAANILPFTLTGNISADRSCGAIELQQ